MSILNSRINELETSLYLISEILELAKKCKSSRKTDKKSLRRQLKDNSTELRKLRQQHHATFIYSPQVMGMLVGGMV